MKVELLCSADATCRTKDDYANNMCDCMYTDSEDSTSRDATSSSTQSTSMMNE